MHRLNLQLTTVKTNFRNSSALKSSNAFGSHKTICFITAHTLLVQGKLLLGYQTKWCQLTDSHVNNTKSRFLLPLTITTSVHGSTWMKTAVIYHSLQPTPEPPSPATSRMVVLPWSSTLFRAKHKIGTESLMVWAPATTNLCIKMSSDWPLWEPLSTAIPYKYLKQTYPYTTPFHHGHTDILAGVLTSAEDRKHFTVTVACLNF